MGIDRLDCVTDITLVIGHATKMFPWQKTVPHQRHEVDEDPPKPIDQEQDIAMADAASDIDPHGGQEKAGQTKSCCPTWKSQAQPNRNGSSWKNLPIHDWVIQNGVYSSIYLVLDRQNLLSVTNMVNYH